MLYLAIFVEHFLEIKKNPILQTQNGIWAVLDLNQGPKDYESSALTAELMAQVE